MKSNNNEYEYATIIDDEEEQEEENHLETVEREKIKSKKTRNRVTPLFLKRSFFEEEDIMEIGVDEAGRGPLFGRVYTAAVVLPKDMDRFDHTLMKDSKKFHSKSKIIKVAEYIKENAIDWSVTYEDEKTIDEINILQATQKSMHHSINNILSKNHLNNRTNSKISSKLVHLLIDGNYFNPISFYDKKSKKINVVPHICIESGDNKYSAIAAASILAKVSRDKYIEDLCEEYPDLAEKYAIDTNKGYGAKKHLDGIKEYGITQWHRKSFGICKEYA
jgi:ribonuclease HII